ncbi:DeoR family transcriptional regulator [Paraburkholderia ginsengiterrae]|uniref:DeoR family transcriptional regulator n=1 Tax=Paraburkholderia ginsengiterrae TaxID=1462993 RepID=A0A1A9NAW3_9BURK|nr:DeoR/GlpR family DNA-binding transcription regulator [Paraburkholderia ginsengiterrae]OAJ62382.1 DeoR family transcriptional regulator [Paraburkholderia ginsengiterrae]OAJ63052.1 DeoR family transcriptional regulator [Paraburkholderia ginsengiterrae]
MQRTRQEAVEGLLPEQREQFILERLRTNGRVLAATLATELQTSEHTIRRHLRDLADQGHCKRVYGGALLLSPAGKPAAVRMGEAVDRKARLAAAAVSIVRPKQIILLDAGSTNVAIAEALPDNAGLTVVTNSPEACLRLLNRPGFDVILVGGRIASGAAGSLGATALLQIQQIRADLCFLGACAFDPDEGVAAFEAEDAELKRAMVKASGQIAIALTSEKLMTAAPFSVAPANAVDHLFVEADVPAERLTTLEAVCDNVMVARP